RLKPAFREAGVVTAGNASQISDGASALVIASAREAERRRLPVLARIVEHDEAFATASCAVRKELGIPDDRFNVNGGAIALGHPIGASGARVLTTLLHALRARRGRRGVATLCLGGGGAVSLLVEAL